MQKKIWSFFLVSFLCVFLKTEPLKAEGFSLGLVFGDPSGLSAKVKLSDKNALAGGLSWFVRDVSFFQVYGDYLWMFPGLFQGQKSEFLQQISGYIGVGGILLMFSGRYRYYNRDYSDFGAGLRIPFGLEWKSKDIPLSVFAEVVPGLGVIPGMNTFVQGGLGLRYHFN